MTTRVVSDGYFLTLTVKKAGKLHLNLFRLSQNKNPTKHGGTRHHILIGVLLTKDTDSRIIICIIRLWTRLTTAIGDKNMDAATDAKTSVEEAQRELQRKRDESGEKFVPRFFEKVDGRWVPKFK